MTIDYCVLIQPNWTEGSTGARCSGMTDLVSGIGQELIGGIALGCIYALVALGFTLIYRATEVVNFAQGELMMVGAYANFFLVTWLMGDLGVGTGLAFVLALLGAVAFATVFGALLDLVINRPLKDEPVFSVIMATIGLSIVLRALVGMIAGPLSLVVPSPFGRGVLEIGSMGVPVLDLVVIVATLLLVALFYVVFRRTRWGIAVQAASEDPVAARLMGIPVRKVYRTVWIFAAVVATLAGLLLAPRVALLDTSMGLLGLKAFPAAVLGGFGSIPGAILGGIILGIIETVSAGTLSFHFEWVKEINDIVVWLVLIAVLMIRPAGILGTEKVKKV